MDTILTFDSYYGREKIEILFSDNLFRISIYGDDPIIYEAKYTDIYKFFTANHYSRTDLFFQGENIQESRPMQNKSVEFFKISVLNENSLINFEKIFEDRTPIKSENTKILYKNRNFEYKMRNSTKFGYGKVYLKISRAFCYNLVIDNVRKFSTYSLPYENGYRVLTLPLNTWSIKVQSTDSDNMWTTNVLVFNLTKEQPNTFIKLDNKLFGYPDICFM